jgi:hypothetical protein
MVGGISASAYCRADKGHSSDRGITLLPRDNEAHCEEQHRREV